MILSSRMSIFYEEINSFPDHILIIVIKKIEYIDKNC